MKLYSYLRSLFLLFLSSFFPLVTSCFPLPLVLAPSHLFSLVSSFPSLQDYISLNETLFVLEVCIAFLLPSSTSLSSLSDFLPVFPPFLPSWSPPFFCLLFRLLVFKHFLHPFLSSCAFLPSLLLSSYLTLRGANSPCPGTSGGGAPFTQVGETHVEGGSFSHLIQAFIRRCLAVSAEEVFCEHAFVF